MIYELSSVRKSTQQKKSSSQKDLSFKHGEYTFIIHWIISFQVKFLLFLLGDFLYHRYRRSDLSP